MVTLQLSALMNWDMSVRLLHHLIRVPLPWFQRRKLADVLSRFDAIGPVRSLISGGLIVTTVDGLLVLTTLAMMFMLASDLAWLALAGLMLYVAIRLVALPFSIRLGMQSLVAHVAENGKRIETIRAIQTIKAMGAEQARERTWANSLADCIRYDQRLNLTNQVFTSALGLLSAMIMVFIVFNGAGAIIDGSMSVGLLYAFMAYEGQFMARSSAFFEQLVQWRMTDMYSHRLADVVLVEREHGVDAASPDGTTIDGAVELSNVAFAYAPQDPYVLRGVSLRIDKGEFVAIVGPSGAGKSTLLKIVCGLYTPTAGEVILDGRTVKAWGTRTVRRSFGTVMQDDELLSGTIAENVAFFDEQIDLPLVWRCLQRAAIDEDIRRMPMGTDTYIGDMGGTLSGGQKQRLLLARALYRMPKILLLDEATSHLDAQCEARINAALKLLAITRIVVAHRRETIDSADRIICLDGGGRVCSDRSRQQYPSTER
ncbi:peptidase domain-containing ABC transporter [Massilia genomosp. 1]|nr:peptidase domain-containing ABC transporter [Massilia genomosp. 1]